MTNSDVRLDDVQTRKYFVLTFWALLSKEIISQTQNSFCVYLFGLETLVVLKRTYKGFFAGIKMKNPGSTLPGFFLSNQSLS
jgi:hypothetical protein